MSATLEDAHVRSKLGNQDRGQDAIDAGDFRQPHVLLAVGRKLAVDALIELGDVLVELLETRELHLEHEAMMFLDPAFECEFELGQLLTQPPFCELGHLLRRRITPYEPPASG